jgi:hypothetical protein
MLLLACSILYVYNGVCADFWELAATTAAAYKRATPTTAITTHFWDLSILSPHIFFSPNIDFSPAKYHIPPSHE